MENWKIDVPVAINFFCRPDTFEVTLSCVRKARPSRLYLIADGPRHGNKADEEGCRKCREIADRLVDWECKVVKLYNESNKGLFVTYFESMAKVFEQEEYCIFMEDDVEFSDSLIPYCKCMLERYKDDKRFSFVTTINYLGNGVYDDLESDYFFCGEGSLYVYGLWKRTFESMNMNFLDSPYSVKAVKDYLKLIKSGYEKRIDKYVNNLMWQGHIPHVEIYRNLLRAVENQLCILPKKNLVRNIGLSAGSVHTANDIHKMPRAMWKVYKTPIYELEFPLKEPTCVVPDLKYDRYYNKMLLWNMPVQRFFRRVESLSRHIIYGDFKRIFEKFRLVFTGKYVFDE